ncbi:MAG: ferritin-like domain-containing protein [Spirochaetia bacterium]|nr:ferritin-like domain-containing protein [Spirochaetia bacterium]
MYEKSIERLNQAVGEELAAVHQYMYFHFRLDDQGYDLLAALFKKTAIEEMIHIERIADRILFLKGDVKLVAADEARQIHDVNEMLDFACRSESKAMQMYNQMAVECGADADSATKKLFESLVEDEERHFSQFDNEMDQLKKFGENYLALQSIERSKATYMNPINRGSEQNP